MGNQVSDYSGLDQFLHKLAFSMPFVQRTLADLEDSLFGKELAAANDRDPIFVTSLPRAGTTTLLTALADLPELASHTYRDMPFVMAPMLWSKMSGSFQRDQAMKERAHGDGIEVNVDSPEAFEEVIWKYFWPSRYEKDRVLTWGDVEYADFEKYFSDHIKKIILLKSKSLSKQGRYISKNNLNISRINYLKKVFPGSTVVIPFRDPLQHSLSLLKQHKNFLEMHKADKFSETYMKDLGLLK